MYNRKNIFKMVLVAIISTALTVLIFACKKKDTGGENSGIVIFKIGDAFLEREGTAKREIMGKDVILQNDIISTGANSSVSIQVADRLIMRVLSDSRVIIRNLSSDKGELFLEKGEVLSKIERLQKENSFKVGSRTCIAAVRGTQFGFSFDGEKTRISVKSGKVAVKPAAKESLEKTPDSGKTEIMEKETIIESGFVGVVEKKTLDALYTFSVRPISESESLKIDKVSIIDLKANLGSVSDKELDAAVEDILKKDKEIDDKIKNLPGDKQAASAKKDKIRELIQKTPKSLSEIKEVFDRIDEISLYNGRKIEGAIISRGAQYKILTLQGVISVPRGDVRDTKVIR